MSYITGIGGIFVKSKDGKFAWIIDPEGTKIELWEPGEGMPD